MKFARFNESEGGFIYVNPDQVRYVRRLFTKEEDSGSIIYFHTDDTIVVKESQSTVIKELTY